LQGFFAQAMQTLQIPILPTPKNSTPYQQSSIFHRRLAPQPYRQVAPPDQRRIILRPVRHLVLRLRKFVTPAVIEFVRHAAPKAILFLPPILPCPQFIVIKQPQRDKAKHNATESLFLHQSPSAKKQDPRDTHGRSAPFVPTKSE
jgi:hypothetical protein